MIKVENMEAFNFEGAIRGMRNPLNSWSKSDSVICPGEYCNSKNTSCPYEYRGKPFHINLNNIFCIGPNDLDLAKRLIKAGQSDRKFLRQIFVSMDVTAPLYWWKEADQYKVSTVTNSCSTMHKLTAKEFELDDFSHENLLTDEGISIDDLNCGFRNILEFTIDALNCAREWYLETNDKKYWYQMIQLLPSSYNQRRTWTLDYETLRGIYHSRKSHKLDEWCEFCEIIKTLPYAEDLIV